MVSRARLDGVGCQWRYVLGVSPPSRDAGTDSGAGFTGTQGYLWVIAPGALGGGRGAGKYGRGVAGQLVQPLSLTLGGGI